MLHFTPHFQLWERPPLVPPDEIAHFVAHFGEVPKEYLDVIAGGADLELRHTSGQYVRIWRPSGCVELDEANEVQKYLPGALPIGDDGGGKMIFYASGKDGLGLYLVGFGNLGIKDAVWIAPTLRSLLDDGVGIDSFLQ